MTKEWDIAPGMIATDPDTGELDVFKTAELRAGQPTFVQGGVFGEGTYRTILEKGAGFKIYFPLGRDSLRVSEKLKQFADRFSGKEDWECRHRDRQL